MRAPLPPKQFEIFLCYDPKDRDLFEQFKDYIDCFKDGRGFLKHDRTFLPWHEEMILAGDEIEETIRYHLDSADIILLLISENFAASEHCNKIMKRALERYGNRETDVASILLKP